MTKQYQRYRQRALYQGTTTARLRALRTSSTYLATENTWTNGWQSYLLVLTALVSGAIGATFFGI